MDSWNIIALGYTPWLIPTYPLAGGFLAMLGDTIDVRLWELDGAINLGVHYNLIDKLLDNYMYIFMAYAAWQWKNKKARNVALGLFAFRTVGVVLYAFTSQRWLYLVFPDIFVFFFFFYLIYLKLTKKDQMDSYLKLFSITTLLAIPKLYQEYLFHIEMIPLYATIKSIFGWL